MQRLSLNERGRRNEISAMHVDGIGGVSAALRSVFCSWVLRHSYTSSVGTRNRFDRGGRPSYG